MEQPQGDSDEGLLERLGNALAPEAPAEEAIEASQPEVADDEQPAEAAQAEEDDGFVELEMEDGETVRVPPKLKDGYLRQSDYTRKTQDLATLQRNAQAVLQQQALMARVGEETREEWQRLTQIDSELKRLKTVDWTQYDTDTLIKTRTYMDQLRDEKGDLERSVSEKQNKTRQQAAQLRAEAGRNAYEFINRHVKDWTPDSSTEREVASYAQNYGIAPEVLSEVSVMFPGFAVLAHKAAQYDRLEKSKGQAVQKAQKAPPVVKPGAVNSNSAQQQKSTEIRNRLKKSGDWKDAAALFMMKGK